MNNQTNETEQNNKGNFMRSLIKINNPDWTPEQIEKEVKKRLAALENPNNDEGCEMCSG